MGTLTDVNISLPTWGEVFRVLTFQAGFNTSIVIIGATLLGFAAGNIGTFALLRNRALMGDALAHCTLPGLALAFIFASLLGFDGKSLPTLLAGATLTGVLGVITVQLLVRYSRLEQDTAIGAILSTFFGAGVVLMSIIQNLGTGQEGGLHHFIFGQTAAMNRFDAFFILAVAILASAVCLALLKEFRLVCFDEQFARSDGWPVATIDLTMMSLVVLVTVFGLQAVGLLLIVALLIIPAAAARFWTQRLTTMTVVAATIGALSGYFGASASALLPRLPAGAVVVLVSGVLFFGSLLFAPERGVLSSMFSALFLRIRIAKEHFLREVYETREASGVDPQASGIPIALTSLLSARNWSLPFRTLMLLILRLDGTVCTDSDGITLSETGVKESALKVRNHRLWEEYLLTHSEISISHVDYSADLVEHFISEELLKKLEHSLHERGKLSSPVEVPRCLHSVDTEETT